MLKQDADFLSVLDRELVLAHVLGVEKEYLLGHSEEHVPGDLEALYYGYLGRVKDGEPVAYILGSKEFFGHNFYVDRRVLVPRPETEHLVERTIDYLRGVDDGDRRLRVLDVGTGSGNIAVSVAKYFEDLGEDVIEEIIALDVSEDACEVARVNAEQLGVDHRVNVFQSDLLDAIEDGSEFDVIVANLPYIGEEKNRFVSAAAEKYEPAVALFGGVDGLELYKKMFQQLEEKGICYKKLYGEFGFAQRGDLEALLSQFFDRDWVIERDLAGIDRIFTVDK